MTETIVDVQRRTSLGMLWITHDEAWASAFADRIVRLTDRSLEEDPPCS